MPKKEYLIKNQIYTPLEIKRKINKVSISAYGNMCVSAIYNIQETVDIRMTEHACEELEEFIRKIIPNVNDIYTTV